jgi:predicted enzyme related to lactoylglutathione lyase
MVAASQGRDDMTANTEYRTWQFVWRELMTTDVAASLRFYGETFGWKAETMTMPDGNDYTLVSVGEMGVGGIMKNPAAGLPAYWSAAVSVDDVDAVAGRAAAAGGKVIVPPMDAGGMGRYAGLMDPQGAVVNAWRSNGGDGPAPERPGPGMFCWEQLNTTDPAGALAFYGKVFGWSNKPFGGGGGGDMKVFELGARQIGSVMANPPGVPAHWLSYVVVEKLSSTYDRVKKQGGNVMIERLEIPTVGAIGVIQDNVGAVLGLFENPGA